MLKKFVLGSLACAAMLCATSNAHAVYITTSGDVEATSLFPAAGPPLTPINKLSTSGGNVYTNQVSGAPFALGSEIRSISVQTLTTADVGGFLPVLTPAGDPIIIITAIRGTVTSVVGTTSTATFTEGRSALSTQIAGFSTLDPTTWNFAGRFSEFVLSPPDSVVTGPTGNSAVTAAIDVNTSTVNSGFVVPTPSQGRVAFLEDSTAGQNAVPMEGDDFLNDLANPTAFPVYEGLFSVFAQTLEDLSSATVTSTFGGTALADLNDIMGWAIGAGIANDLDAAAGDQGAYFATGLGGAAVTDFTPDFLQAAPNTGDHRAIVSSDNSLVVQPVPEPSSIALLLVGAGALGLYRRRRATKIVS